MTEYVEVHCGIRTTTPNAVLVDDGIRHQWIPISCLDTDADDIEDAVGDSIDLRIAYWFAHKNGMI